MKKKNPTRPWDDIILDLQRMSNMSCKPASSKPRIGDVIDEDKSIRWNREQIEKKIIEYEKEVKDLNTKKNELRDKLHMEAIDKIAYYLDIAPNKARHIWNYAYSEGHSNGYSEVINIVEELIILFSDVLK